MRLSSNGGGTFFKVGATNARQETMEKFFH